MTPNTPISYRFPSFPFKNDFNTLKTGFFLFYFSLFHHARTRRIERFLGHCGEEKIKVRCRTDQARWSVRYGGKEGNATEVRRGRKKRLVRAKIKRAGKNEVSRQFKDRLMWVIYRGKSYGIQTRALGALLCSHGDR